MRAAEAFSSSQPLPGPVTAQTGGSEHAPPPTGGSPQSRTVRDGPGRAIAVLPDCPASTVTRPGGGTSLAGAGRRGAAV